MTAATQDRACGDSDVLALPLLSGGHSGGTGEFHGECCLVEKSNRIAFCIPQFRERFGAPERFTDDHPSISRVVRSMAIGLTDISDEAWGGVDARTAALDRFSVAILGTATTPEDEEARAWMATDWLVRTYTPAWLRLAGLTTEPQALEGLARVVDSVTARAAQPTLVAARERAEAARDAAVDAAGNAAEAAAIAAGDAARDAAWAAWDAAEAAWAAVGNAGGDAAGAAWDAAGNAARDAAGAAWDAAGNAARDAARDARDAAGNAAEAAAIAAGDAGGDAAWAAWDAAEAALAPTSAALRSSAIALLDAMINLRGESYASA